MPMIFLLSGCDLLDDLIKLQVQKELEQHKAQTAKKEQQLQRSKEVQLRAIDAKTQEALAKIEAQKELEKLKKEQMLEKIRLEADLQKQKVQLEVEKQKALLAQKMSQMQLESDMEIKRYFVFILLVVLIVISYFIYLYFKIRHQNKLHAYQNNLDKYFHQQENATKMRIAEKIIDTVASGKLDKHQETELIKALSGTMQQPTATTPTLPKIDDDVEEAQLIEK